MYYQTNPSFSIEYQHNACYFSSLALFRQVHNGYTWTIKELQDSWDTAKEKGYIDPTSLLIIKPNDLCNLLGLSLQYIDGHYNTNTPIPENTWIIGCWKNNTFTHFTALNNDLSVLFDSITYDGGKTGSNTVKNGHLDSLRLYRITA